MNAALFLLLLEGDGELSIVVAGPFRSVASQSYSPGSNEQQQSHSPGAVAGQDHTPGSLGGQFV